MAAVASPVCRGGELADVVDFHLAGVLAISHCPAWSRWINSVRRMTMPGGGLRSEDAFRLPCEGCHRKWAVKASYRCG